MNKVEDTSTGLTQLGARVYDATIGKFLTVDPILAPDNPQPDNGYDYSANNPVTFNDPSGMVCMTASGDLNFNHACAPGKTIAPAKRATLKNVSGASSAVPFDWTGWGGFGAAAGKAAQSGAAAAGAAVGEGFNWALLGSRLFGGIGTLGLILSMSGDTNRLEPSTGPVLGVIEPAESL